MFGQWLRLSDERVKILVAAGAGSAIAAAFNAPIAGVFFALELILGEISGNALWLILRFNGCFCCFHTGRFRKRAGLSSASLSISFGMGIALISFAGSGCGADLRIICRPAL